MRRTTEASAALDGDRLQESRIEIRIAARAVRLRTPAIRKLCVLVQLGRALENVRRITLVRIGATDLLAQKGPDGPAEAFESIRLRGRRWRGVTHDRNERAA